MSDLVERLRAMGAAQRPHIGDEAADEIERLETHKDHCFDRMRTMQAEIERLRAVVDAAQLLTDSLRVVEEQEDPNLSNATKLARQNDALMRLRVALDKLKEAGDG